MDLTGEYRIPAPRAKVWAALNDPEVLKQCIDGCEELTKESDTDFSAKVTAKVGPVKAKFAGKVTLLNMDPPNGYTIRGEGQGGVAGFAKGSADVKLAEDGADTLLTYAARAEVGGKLASVGSRLVEGVAKKTADDFFGRLSRIVGNGTGAPTGEAVAQPEPAAALPVSAEPPPPPPSALGPYAGQSGREGEDKQGISPWIWGAALVAVIGILWYVLAR